VTKRARVSAIDEIAPNVFEIHASMVEPAHLPHTAGQSVTIRIASNGEQRSYSLACPPGQTNTLVLLVRRVGGVGSQFLASLAVGAEIELEGPNGEFRLADAGGTLVFGATGVGVSALFPMMETALARPDVTRVLFFWGLMNPEDVFWQERLSRLHEDPRFASHIVLSGAGQGFVTQPIIDTAVEHTGATYYLCGNGQMVRDVIYGLTQRGVDRERQIRTDWY